MVQHAPAENNDFLPLLSNSSPVYPKKNRCSNTILVLVILCVFGVLLAVTFLLQAETPKPQGSVNELLPKESKNIFEDTYIPLTFVASRSNSSRKTELLLDNNLERGYVNLGLGKHYVRVNTVNRRVQKRRERMRAFDQIRRNYCGDVNDENNRWVRNLKKKPFHSKQAGLLETRYARNTIDYALAYNDHRYSMDTVIKDHLNVSELIRLTKLESERSINLFTYKPKTYFVKRFICERKWGIDAPEGYENDDLTVTIERLGPFKSYGDYDWNTILDYNDAANLSSKVSDRDIFVSGTFFLPVFANGSIISYPPLHVHHTHLHPYSGKGMKDKIEVDLARIKQMILEFEGNGAIHAETSKEYESLKEIFVDLKKKGMLEDLKTVLSEALQMKVNHHVVLQGHGDGECTIEQGGSDCVLHLLEPGHGYRVHDTQGFTGNFEINDVRNRNRNYTDYLATAFSFEQSEKAMTKVKEYFKDHSAKLSSSILESIISSLDDNSSPHTQASSKSRNLEGTLPGYDQYIDKLDEHMLEFYIDVGIIWSKKKKIETTFLQFGNPPTGMAWMTYAFPLDRHSNFMFYNFTNYFLGSGELSNFILHTHMVYADSIYVFKGDDVFGALDKYLTENKGSLPYIFECHNTNLDVKKQEILQLVLDTSAELVCEGTKPTLVLYCDKKDDDNCIYRDRRIDFNCLEKVRLEEGEILSIITFNRVRDFTTGGKEARPDIRANEVPNLNSLAVSSSFGLGWVSHQHSFFRGDFVSDKARAGLSKFSTGKAEEDILLGRYFPPAYFWYGFWREKQWEIDQQIKITKDCPNNISFDAYLPWEHVYDDIVAPFL